MSKKFEFFKTRKELLEELQEHRRLFQEDLDRQLGRIPEDFVDDGAEPGRKIPHNPFTGGK